MERLELFRKTEFKKDIKRLLKQNNPKLKSELEKVISFLLNRIELDIKYRNHLLIGN